MNSLRCTDKGNLAWSHNNALYNILPDYHDNSLKLAGPPERTMNILCLNKLILPLQW